MRYVVIGTSGSGKSTFGRALAQAANCRYVELDELHWAEQLWHGNRESLSRAFFSKESILLWALTTYKKNQDKYARLRAGGQFAHLTWQEFTTLSEATRFVALSRLPS